MSTRINSKEVLREFLSEDNYLRNLISNVLQRNITKYCCCENWAEIVAGKIFKSIIRYEKRKNKIKA